MGEGDFEEEILSGADGDVDVNDDDGNDDDIDDDDEGSA